MTSKNLALAAAAAAGLLLIAAGAAMLWRGPVVAEAKIMQILQTSGFDRPEIKTRKTGPGRLRLEGIAFDPDSFSSAKSIELRYNPLTGAPSALTIEGLEISGETAGADADKTDAPGGLTLSGWTKPAQFNAGDLLDFETVTCQKCRITLLTEAFGGVNIDYDFQIRRQGNTAQITGKMQSRQQALDMRGTLTGSLDRAGQWFAEAELEQGKFDLGHIRAARMSGSLSAAGESYEPHLLEASLQAGSLNLYDYPLQNATITLDTSPGFPKLFLAGKATAASGIEFTLSTDNASSLSGSLLSENAQDLIAYARTFSDDKKALAPLEQLSGEEAQKLQTVFAGLYEGLELKGIRFKMNSASQSYDLEGKIIFNDSGFSFEELKTSHKAMRKKLPR